MEESLIKAQASDVAAFGRIVAEYQARVGPGVLIEGKVDSPGNDPLSHFEGAYGAYNRPDRTGRRPIKIGRTGGRGGPWQQKPEVCPGIKKPCLEEGRAKKDLAR